MTHMRMRVLASMCAALALMSMGSAPVHAADDSKGPKLTLPSTIAIGDSVMLGAVNALRKQGVDVIDAKKNRQAPTGIDIIRERGRTLPTNVVFHLGTNGTFPSTLCRDILRAVGRERRVFILTLAVPRKWEAPNNARIRRCAQTHADRVTLIDWHRAVSQRGEWVAGDGVHLRPLGANGYARLIAKAVRGAE